MILGHWALAGEGKALLPPRPWACVQEVPVAVIASRHTQGLKALPFIPPAILEPRVSVKKAVAPPKPSFLGQPVPSWCFPQAPDQCSLLVSWLLMASVGFLI